MTGEQEIRDIILRIFLDNNIQHRLDLPRGFFAQFNKRNEVVRKQASFYKFENAEYRIICAIYVIPEEYFKLYRIYYETRD